MISATIQYLNSYRTLKPEPMNNLIRLSPAHWTTEPTLKPVVDAKPVEAVVMRSPI